MVRPWCNANAFSDGYFCHLLSWLLIVFLCMNEIGEIDESLHDSSGSRSLMKLQFTYFHENFIRDFWMYKNQMWLQEFFGSVVKAKCNYHLTFICHEFYKIWPHLKSLRYHEAKTNFMLHFCKSFNNLTASGHIEFIYFLVDSLGLRIMIITNFQKVCRK